MSPPFLPLYVADYLSATTHLNAAESGAYLHLLMHYWQKGILPKEDRFLARIARMTDRQWAAARPVMREFFNADWINSRLEKERAKALAKSEARAEYGSHGGHVKALKFHNTKLAKAMIKADSTEKPSEGESGKKNEIAHPLENAEAQERLILPADQSKQLENNDPRLAKASPELGGLLQQKPSKPPSKTLPFSQDIHKEEERSKSKAPKAPDPVSKRTPSDVLSETIGDVLAQAVVEHRQRIRKPLTAFAADLLAKSLRECADPAASARMMIERGWMTVKPGWGDAPTSANARGPPQSRRPPTALSTFQRIANGTYPLEDHEFLADEAPAHTGPTIEGRADEDGKRR